jgi:hypothetical protein
MTSRIKKSAGGGELIVDGRWTIVRKERAMKVLGVLVLWAILLILYWPLAVLVLLAWPVVWLLSIPFQIIVMGVNALLALLKGILFLPARVMGYRT